MMELPRWGLPTLSLYYMVPALPRSETEVRMRARPFIWEIGPCTFPKGRAQPPVFQVWKSV